MNLYLVLALALGVTAPAVSPRVANPVAVAPHALRRIVVQFTVRSAQFAEKKAGRELRSANCEPREAPLTGAASPRAPAFRC